MFHKVSVQSKFLLTQQQKPYTAKETWAGTDGPGPAGEVGLVFAHLNREKKQGWPHILQTSWHSRSSTHQDWTENFQERLQRWEDQKTHAPLGYGSGQATKDLHKPAPPLLLTIYLFMY